ncbi:MAG: metallophosphoesterase [Oscillospiraceae bacterium]|nr:metallophosphoesterase [Oscillospiraceae bacterium]
MAKKFFHSRIGSFVFFALAVCAFFFLRSATFAHGWMAEIYGASFVSIMLWIIPAIAAVLLIYMLLPERLRDNKALRIVHVVFCVLGGVVFGYTAQILFSISWPVMGFTYVRGWDNLAPSMVYLLAILVLPFAWLVVPVLKRRSRTAIAVLASVILVVMLVAPYIADHAQTLGMETLPLVLDIGDDKYSVVFVTTRRAAAHVQIDVDDGETTYFASAEDGRLRTGTVHSVIIPREQLNNHTYRIILREVLLSVDSGVEYGEVYTSRDFNFRGEFIDNPNILLGADLHNQGDNMILAAENFDAEPDLFIMLGDMSAMLNTPQRLNRYIIGFGGDVTGGEIPAIFVRGNHEMYGEYTHLIRPGLGMPSFYFQTRRGNILFTVVDSVDWHGEAPDFRPHVRDSANGWTNDLFRQEQIDWLASLEPGDETLHFLLVHRPNFGHDDLFAQMVRLGTHMQLSGETHRLALELPGAEGNRFEVPFPLLVAGGPSQGYGGPMICSMLHVRGMNAHVIAYCNDNVRHMDETIELSLAQPPIEENLYQYDVEE